MGKLYQDACERLRAQGGRMTSQRRLILDMLDSVGDHPTAEELFEMVRVRDPNLNLSTVYRTLRWLEGEGLVSARRFDEEHRQDRFDPGHPSEHYHFLCSNCKKVIEFDHQLVNEICEQFEGESGAVVSSASVVLYGLCAGCRESGEAP
jgi:Fe2+ or Zn2+ uptake regulation protein